MAGVYVDTSALGRVLLGEPDASAALSALGRFDEYVASRLLALELRRLALRHGVLDAAGQLLAGVALVPLNESVLAAAETVAPAEVASLDAIHLVTALRLATDGAIDALMTYDERLARAATVHGIEVLAPA